MVCQKYNFSVSVHLFCTRFHSTFMMFELYFGKPLVATHLYNILDRHVFVTKSVYQYVFTILIIFQYAVNPCILYDYDYDYCSIDNTLCLLLESLFHCLFQQGHSYMHAAQLQMRVSMLKTNSGVAKVGTDRAQRGPTNSLQCPTNCLLYCGQVIPYVRLCMDIKKIDTL